MASKTAAPVHIERLPPLSLLLPCASVLGALVFPAYLYRTDLIAEPLLCIRLLIVSTALPTPRATVVVACHGALPWGTVMGHDYG